jgi:hypothetical protein
MSKVMPKNKYKNFKNLQYYSLIINGEKYKIHYINHDEDNEEVFEKLGYENNFSIAWTDKSDKKKHTFLFRLSDSNYLLTIGSKPNSGINVRYFRKLIRNIDHKNYKGSNKWRKGIITNGFGGCESLEPNNFKRTISEGNNNEHLYIIEVKIVQLPQKTIELAKAEIEHIIKNPIIF